jgi:hypothetical protein
VPPLAELLESTARRWLADPESDVVHVEWLEGRLATRVVQHCRDATTVWWEPGERTLRVEAYLLPAPASASPDPYVLCLRRNLDTFRVSYALDREGSVVLRARVPVSDVDADVLDEVLGEIYDQVELSFRPLARLAFPREKSR